MNSIIKRYNNAGVIIFLVVVYLLINFGGWIFYLSLSDAFDTSLSDSIRSILISINFKLETISREEMIKYLEVLDRASIADNLLLLDKQFVVNYDAARMLAIGQPYPFSPLIRNGITGNRYYVSESYEKDGEVYKIGVTDLGEYYVVMLTPTFMKEKLARLRRILFVVGFISFIGLFVLGLIMDIVLKRLVAAERDTEVQERLAALGRLSAGVAHEIRNPLGIISGTAEVLKKKAHLKGEDKQLLSYIEEESSRIEKVVRDFLNLSQQGLKPAASVPADLNEEIEKVVVREEHLLRDKGIEIEIELDAGLGKITCTPDEVASVIRNLVQNAAEALADSREKIIRITTKNSGHEALLVIEDSGAGIADDIRHRVFDPFFTTKPDGTGMGLSIVKGVIEGKNGRIELGRSQWNGARVAVAFKNIERGM